MLKSRFWRGAALVTAVCGLAGAGTGTAVAASAATPTVTIAAKSAFQPVTGDTFVEFLGSTTTDAATISGTVSGATSGDQLTITLLAGKFGVAGSPVVTSTHTAMASTTGAATYSFTVRPGLRTSYEVRVTDGNTVVGTSGVKTVYVVAPASVTGKTGCSRPVCHITLKVSVKVPISAYATETAKHWYLYSRLFLGKQGEPTAPKLVELSNTATASKPAKLHTYEFAVTIRFAFRIGNDGYAWAIQFCTKDSEPKDGVGLPGTHGCGNKWVSAEPAYLG